MTFASVSQELASLFDELETHCADQNIEGVKEILEIRELDLNQRIYPTKDKSRDSYRICELIEPDQNVELVRAFLARKDVNVNKVCKKPANQFPSDMLEDSLELTLGPMKSPLRYDLPGLGCIAVVQDG